jgi:outer membrane protein assembly factor BamB
MLRRLLRKLAILLVLFTVTGAVLYSFGLRVVLDGGGMPHLRFTESASYQAEKLERHRETTATGSPTVAADPVSPTSYWSDFRGPLRDGHYREQPIRVAWPGTGLVPRWKQPSGGGYASFVVANGRAITIEQRRDEEVVAAYDIATGRELWTNRWKAVFKESMGGDGPRATPTWRDGRIYALGGAGELRALEDATGKLIWRINILEDAGATNLTWGMSASPLVVGDVVIVLPGGPNGRSVVAYDRLTGERRWSALDDRQAYSSPELVSLNGVEQILVFSATRLMGITPDRGVVLWEYPWKTQYDVNASQPLVIGDNRVFVSTGYGTGAAVLEVAREGETFTVREVWRNIRMKNQFTSSVLHEGYIYGLDESILACVDAATGELKWKGGRYGYGQLLLASGHLIVITEQGELALVRATPERHVEIAKFAALDGKTWNHPAMAGGILLVRNGTEMAAYDLRSSAR